MEKPTSVQVSQEARERVLSVAGMLRTPPLDAASILIEVADLDAVIARHRELIDEAIASSKHPAPAVQESPVRTEEQPS